jgi:hypothetical protein
MNYFINVMMQFHTGMLSYPNFASIQFKFEPNVHLLAYLAELENADFRIMVQLRDPKSSIGSVLRRFDAKNSKESLDYIRRFKISQMHLYQQLKALDPSFYVCVQYENIKEEAYNVDTIFADVNNYSFGDAVNEIFNEPAHKPVVGKSIDDRFIKAEDVTRLSNEMGEAMRDIYLDLQKLCDRNKK